MPGRRRAHRRHPSSFCVPDLGDWHPDQTEAVQARLARFGRLGFRLVSPEDSWERHDALRRIPLPASWKRSQVSLHVLVVMRPVASTFAGHSGEFW